MEFSKNSYWFKSGIFSLLQNVTSLIFGLGGFLLLVRILNKDQIGAWTLFLTVTSICEVGRVGFVKNGFVKFLASSDKEFHSLILTASFFLNCAFTLVIVLGMIFFGATFAKVWSTPDLQIMFYIYAVTTVLLIPFFQFEFIQHALLDFKGIFYSYFAKNGFLFLGILASYFGLYHLTIIDLVLFQMGGVLIGSFVSYLQVSKSLVFSKKIDWRWILKLAHYGKYVAGTSLGSMLYSGVDTFMLGSMASTAAVAIYNVAGRITNVINIPSQTLSVIMFPHSAKLIENGGRPAIKDLYEKSVGTVLGIIMPAVIFILLFPEWVILIIAGPSYLDTVLILKITILFSMFFPFSYQFGTVMDSIGYPNFNFYYTVGSLVLNVILNYFLIDKYGVLGAVYGTLFTVLSGFIVMQIMLKVILNVNTLNVFRSMFQFYISCFSAARKLVDNV